MQLKTMSTMALAGKRVLIREDLNVPLEDGRVTSDTRIRAALPTIRQALDAGAAVIVMSHLGRPKEGVYDAGASLAPVAARLGELLGRDVPLVRDWLDGIDVAPGDVALAENVRFNVGEKACVMDAFGTAHRAQASTSGVIEYAREACAGPLLVAELEALGRAMQNPARPIVAIVGGSKVSTKLSVLQALSEKVDTLVVGGGIANTFLAAAGHNVGKSLAEHEMLDMARALSSAQDGADIPLPTDVVVADEFSASAPATLRAVDAVGDNEMILDIGPQTAEQFAGLMRNAGTIIWNGPLGVFEFDAFSHGTRVVAEAIAASPAFSIAGGGDTLAAIEQFGLGDDISYISTGGGAFLEFIEGKPLPAVEALREHARRHH